MPLRDRAAGEENAADGAFGLVLAKPEGDSATTTRIAPGNVKVRAADTAGAAFEASLIGDRYNFVPIIPFVDFGRTERQAGLVLALSADIM